MNPLPLSGKRFSPAVGPVAASLLRRLGGEVRQRVRETDSEAVLWSAAGLTGLCGRSGGPELDPVGRPATLAAAAGEAIGVLTGSRPETVSRLGERARLLGLWRNGATSAGGAARLIPTADGWIVLNLPRPSDVELVPALVEAPVGGDQWQSVADWSGRRSARSVVERCVLLGLAAGVVPDIRPDEAREPWSCTPGVESLPMAGPAVVVNLGSLWAAPLCAQLLAQAGHRVIDVESVTRPDRTPPRFHRVLHDGHEVERLDVTVQSGRSRLAELVAGADVVIEASRPRALQALGVPAEDVMADGRRRVWLRINGHERESGRIAFGDDAAAAGGLVAWDERGPVFAGDALADPLTGVVSALLVHAAMVSDRAWTIDVAMSGVARLAAGL